MEAFKIEVPERVLDDLRERLRRTRWAPEFANESWSFGTRREDLERLCRYWAEDFDWRAVEAKINGYDQYRTEIEGVPIHFLKLAGKGPRPVPLILSHGWPWTFWDFHKVIDPLADPAAFGGDPADAFDVILPSLPGYGFSTPLEVTGINFWRTADLWDQLMRDTLGYERYAAQGGDWGALITGQLGHKYADHLLGLHVNLAVQLSIFQEPLPERSYYRDDEAENYDYNERFLTDGSGYSAIQSTRPQTLSYGLNDSPAGLCAWILEKRRAWSDCEGEVSRRFSLDDLCTTMTIYWVTQSFGSSARYYYECLHNPWTPSHDRTPVIEAPSSVAFFPMEVVRMPRAWAEEYYNLKRWTVMKSGGHFAPMEEPDLLVADIRESFRDLRGA